MSGKRPPSLFTEEVALVTATEGIEWAEQMIAKRGPSRVLAAIVRENELWVRTEGEFWQEGWHGITELYQFVPNGEQVSSHHHEELRFEGGCVYMVYAWADHYHQPTQPRSVETIQALLDAQRKLDAYTDPAVRSTKVLELLRWSHLAGGPDFSSD